MQTSCSSFYWKKDCQVGLEGGATLEKLRAPSLEVNGGAIILRVKRCSHYEEIFGMVSRFLVWEILVGRALDLPGI